MPFKYDGKKFSVNDISEWGAIKANNRSSKLSTGQKTHTPRWFGYFFTLSTDYPEIKRCSTKFN